MDGKNLNFPILILEFFMKFDLINSIDRFIDVKSGKTHLFGCGKWKFENYAHCVIIILIDIQN